MKRVLTVFGTRPEVIKLAPVISACQKRNIEVINFNTGQQPNLTEPAIAAFKIAIAATGEVMTAGQSINALLSKSLQAIETMIERTQPDCVVLQGDTTSALAGALCASYAGIPSVHVEAGLRTFDADAPFPEEINRTLIAKLASLHCAPTALNRKNLLDENVPADSITVTGNPIVDAIQMILSDDAQSSAVDNIIHRASNQHIILVTTHRRENFGKPLERYLQQLHEYVINHPDTCLVFIEHPNPAVQKAKHKQLSKHERIHLLAPLPYADFVKLMKSCTVIVSDSGGIQEEAASVGSPLLILRSSTERPEAVTAGYAKLVPDPNELPALIEEHCKCSGQSSSSRINPFGDGYSGDRIAAAIDQFLGDVR